MRIIKRQQLTVARKIFASLLWQLEVGGLEVSSLWFYTGEIDSSRDQIY